MNFTIRIWGMSADDTNHHPTSFEDRIGSGGQTEDLDLVLEFFHSVCNQIESGSTEAGGEEYEEWVRGHLIDPDILTEVWESTDRPDCVRLTALFNYMTSHGSMFSESNEQMVERYADEFDGQSLYEYCRILCYKNGERSEHRKKIFISGKKAIEEIRGNARLYGRTVSAGIDIVRGAQELPIKYDGKWLDKEDILSECADYGKNATLLAPEGSAWYRRYATVLELQGRYDKAEKQLRKALELQLDRGGPTDHIREELDELNKNRQRHELEKGIERADERLTTIDTNLSRVESELDETTNQYRSDFIQFIGFFAAILTITLTSVQIATTLSFPQSGGLVLVLIGGITISFGELETLFGNSADDKDGRNWESMIVGAALIVIGLGVGTGLLGLLSF